MSKKRDKKKAKRIRGSFWKHSQFKFPFIGDYRTYGGERNFVLAGHSTKGKKRKITFDNWQEAHKAGWRRA